MRRKKEDKIIEMLNENVDIDLNENYHNTLAKIRESSHTYEEKPFKYRKGLSIGLLALTLIIFFSLPILLVSTMGTKKSSPRDGEFNSDDKELQYMDSIESASSNTIYGKYIEDSTSFDITYLYVNELSKIDMEIIFEEYGIVEDIIEEINTYTIIIGKVDGVEKLAYTNGNECIDLNINCAYSIYDIYLNLKEQANSDIKNISLYIDNGDIVYYYSDGVNVYKYMK